MWSQAAASTVVWVVVTAYSMTSALGHAALNRFDTTGQRAQTAQVYQNLSDDLKRAEEQAGWIPQHRPFEMVQSSIDGLKTEKAWKWSEGCTKVSGKSTRELCQQFHTLNAELAAASEARSADERISVLKDKIAGMAGTTALSATDPQAKVLADLAGAFVSGVSIEHVQMAMTIFIALLLEIGSGFGMYVAFSQWRIKDAYTPTAPRMRRDVEDDTVAAAVAAPALNAIAVKKPRSGANDNRSIEKDAERPAIEAHAEEANVVEVKPEVKAESKSAPARLVAPETDVQRFYKENIEAQDGSSVTATQLYEDYCSWCETKSKEPLALPSFGREFADLGVKKERIAGRVRYIGISLKSDAGYEEATKTPTYQSDAA